MSGSRREFADFYGNKAANLHELTRICPDNIPRFHPISHNDVSSYLDACAAGWRDLWLDFQVAQGEDNLAITSDARAILESLRTLILNTFERSPMDAAVISSFLTDVAQSQLMVRSTGDEDSVDVANPGGNESVSAVAPNMAAISKAMGIVVASYFSEKSLKQRLLSSSSDIVKDAFMPVLLQQMIGEPLNGSAHSQDIVRSGVMYTGAGMTRIQVAPGHGELVVNSKGWFDTFIVTREEIVYPEIAKKVYRLVPMATGLDWKKNPQDLQNGASLELPVVKRLANLGRQIEQHYEMPMDVEFIYEPKVDKISIVQARPIPTSRVVNVIPSSVPAEKIPELKALIKDDAVQKIAAQVITPAGFAAKIITDFKQILMCNTLEDALNQYLKQTDSAVQVVIVKQMAPTTSHEAAQFNAMRIPVLQLDNLSELQSLFTSPVTLLVDPQRNSIFNLTRIIAEPLDAKVRLEKLGFLKDGLVMYPVTPTTPIQIFLETRQDIVPENAPLGMLIESNTEAALRLLYSNIAQKRLDTANIYTQLLQNLEILEAAANPAALEALNTIRYILSRISRAENGKVTFFSQSMILCEEIERKLTGNDGFIHDDMREEYLSLIARLKSFISLPAHRDIFSNSILQIMQEKKWRKSLDQSLMHELSHDQIEYLSAFLKLNRVAYNPENKARWTNFVKFCIQSGVDAQRLAEIVKFYFENQIESDLINVDLKKIMQADIDSRRALEILYKDYMQAKEEFASLRLDEKRNIIQSWEQRIPEWSDPSKFETLWHAYEQDLVPLINSLNIIEPWDLAVMESLPDSENFERIPGTAQKVIVVAAGEIYFLDKKNKSCFNLGKVNDYDNVEILKLLDIQEGSVRFRKLSAIERSIIYMQNSSFDLNFCSIMHSLETLDPSSILSSIPTDFAYVLSADKLYFVNKRTHSCTISRIDGEDLGKIKTKIVEQCVDQTGPVNLALISSYQRSMVDYFGKFVLKDHHFLNVEYSLLTQKSILNGVLQLAELMDKTIKSLKSSIDYSEEQQELLVGRFVTLLKPYYQLMCCWMRTLPAWKLSDCYKGVPMHAILPLNHLHDTLNAMQSVLDKRNRTSSELHPSGSVAIDSAKLGSGANFKRQFVQLKQHITFEDLFSLFHQNILTAVTMIKQITLKEDLDSLPNEIHPLVKVFADSSSKSRIDLLSTQSSFPYVILQYNLTMQNHSAVFIIVFNQETQQVKLHGKISGENWNSRMQNLISIHEIDAIILDLTVEKQPSYCAKTLFLDFIWTFPASRLAELSKDLCQIFCSYNSIMSTSNPQPYDITSRFPNMLHKLASHQRLDVIAEKRLNFKASDSKILLSKLKASQLANELQTVNTETLRLVIEVIFLSNPYNETCDFFNTLVFLKEPLEKENYEKLVSIVRVMNKLNREDFNRAIYKVLPKDKPVVALLAPIAVNYNCVNVVTFLIDEYGLDLSKLQCVPGESKTLLFLAVQRRFQLITTKLLQHTSPPFIPCVDTKTNFKKMLFNMCDRIIDALPSDGSDKIPLDPEALYSIDPEALYSIMFKNNSDEYKFFKDVFDNCKRRHKAENSSSSSASLDPATYSPDLARATSDEQVAGGRNLNDQQELFSVEVPPDTVKDDKDAKTIEDKITSGSGEEVVTDQAVNYKQELISLLQNYLRQRKTQKSLFGQEKQYYNRSCTNIFNFFKSSYKHLSSHSLDEKSQAVAALIKLLNDPENLEPLTDINISTLRNGRLGKILRNFIKTHAEDVCEKVTVGLGAVPTVTDFLQKLNTKTDQVKLTK